MLTPWSRVDVMLQREMIPGNRYSLGPELSSNHVVCHSEVKHLACDRGTSLVKDFR